jgi:hypothetical protein
MIEVVKLFTSSKAKTFQRSSSIPNRARMNLAQSPCDIGLVRIEDDDLPAGSEAVSWRKGSRAARTSDRISTGAAGLSMKYATDRPFADPETAARKAP